jgi:hypothetical protein
VGLLNYIDVTRISLPLLMAINFKLYAINKLVLSGYLSLKC